MLAEPVEVAADGAPALSATLAVESAAKIIGRASTVFGSVSAFIAGTFVGLFLLFYILADWNEFSV